MSARLRGAHQAVSKRCLDLLALGLSGRLFRALEVFKEPESVNRDYFCSADCGHPGCPFDRRQTVHGAIDADDDALNSH